MERQTKVMVAAGGGAAVLLALAIGVIGAFAAAWVLDDDGDARALERVRDEPRVFAPFADPGFLEVPPVRYPARGVDRDVAAEYLGLSEDEVRERLHEGDTLADIAEDEDKSVDGLVEALVEAERDRIDEAAQEAKEDLDERVTDLVNGEFAPLFERDFHLPRRP
jgi:hypothetical protein